MWAWLFAAAAVSTCCRWANKLNENFVYCNNYPSSAGNCLRWLLVSFAPEYGALSGWGHSPLWEDYLPKCTDFPWKWTDIIRQALALAFHYVLSLVCGETASKAPTSCDSMEMWAGSRTIRRACVGNSHRASVCVPGIRSKKKPCWQALYPTALTVDIDMLKKCWPTVRMRAVCCVHKAQTMRAHSKPTFMQKFCECHQNMEHSDWKKYAGPCKLDAQPL